MADRSIYRMVDRLPGQLRRADARLYPVSAGSHRPLASLQPALAALPTETHRAVFRLILAAVAARWHLATGDSSGWPSFILFGPSKTGKSLLTDGALRVLGLDGRHHRSLPTETEGRVWGRLAQQRGGVWRFTPSPILGRPLLIIDEFDKAAADVRRACLRLLQGEASVAGEADDLVRVRCTVVVTGNGGPTELPPEYQRRSIVVDTGPLVPALDDIHADAAAFLASLPSVDLGHVRPPADRVPADLAETILDLARDGLSDAGWRACDERCLLNLTLGMAALQGGDLLEAGRAVVRDYLVCADTVGETARFLPARAPGRQPQTERARIQADVARLRLAGRKGRALAELDDAIPDPERFTGAERGHAAEVAGILGEVRHLLGEAGTIERVDELLDESLSLVEAGRRFVAAEGSIEGEGWEAEEPRPALMPAPAPRVSRPWRCGYCATRYPEHQVDALHVCPSCHQMGLCWQP